MRYSLLSRFQGGLLGSLIGETLASRNQQVSIWSRIGVHTAESLIGSSHIADWEQAIKPKFATIKNTASSSEVALATLPVAIFFHESTSLLREKLEQATTVWQLSSETSNDVLVWGYAIALALRERLAGPLLISQLLSLKVDGPLVQQLEQVQFLLKKGSGLEQAVNQLTREGHSSCSIVLALYCFSSTSEDFRLCIGRAIQTNYQPQLTSALAGGLAGVYNSFGGIPIGWRRAVNRDRPIEDSHHRVNRLFATWSGIYEPDTVIPTTAVVASPLVIQRRSSLKIISQEE